MSSEIPVATRSVGQRPSGDRLAALEGKLARMEGKGNFKQNNRDVRNSSAYINGREVCNHYNLKDGCRRPAIPGGCKADNKKEYAHACNVWVKAKSAFCLLPHSSKDHK